MRFKQNQSVHYNLFVLLALLALSNLAGDSEGEGFQLPNPPECEDCGAVSRLIVFQPNGIVGLTDGGRTWTVDASLEGIEEPSDWSLEGLLPEEGFVKSVTLAPSVGAETTITIEPPAVMPVIEDPESELPFAPLTLDSYWETQMVVVANPSLPEIDVQRRALRIRAHVPRVGTLRRNPGIGWTDKFRDTISFRDTTEAELEVVVRGGDLGRVWDISVEIFGPLVKSVEVIPGTVFGNQAKFRMEIVDLETIDEWELIKFPSCRTREIVLVKATEGETTITAPERVIISVSKGVGTCPDYE